ncbi:hypothetical protein CONPUDRAFT_154721 [Coniophora puteana RWD-64-598 SS2]|uniref:Uncharacterized protein n=1 Tax=Coniophora puteana (strain RWD-64-598) TaxID=741705 RepID=A0A5M3MPT8_CONPW|nr:uncharacterized protein CONPUDRAFT_154721 [Coniophora puteana RWD-64-598 SS2]EIW80714.1 hypothetical protein CONPUDRAFT_154721 [Coniophora puteana RWD-64-598 SS2]
MWEEDIPNELKEEWRMYLTTIAQQRSPTEDNPLQAHSFTDGECYAYQEDPNRNRYLHAYNSNQQVFQWANREYQLWVDNAYRAQIGASADRGCRSFLQH